MKATGIVRRIDELGRIVIPKEIRRTFRIKEGTPLEIFCGDTGELILKKYSMVLEIKDFACDIANTIFATLNFPVLINDKDQVIACAGIQKNLFVGKSISDSLEKQMEQRRIFVKNRIDGDNITELVKDDVYLHNSQVIVPIVCGGDICGAIVLFTKEQVKFSATEAMLLKGMANFIGEQIT